MKSFTSFVLLAILLGCNAIDYRYKHGLKAGGCPPALLAQCKENWDPASCALCGNGGLGLFPNPLGFPFGGGIGGLFPFQQSPIIIGGGGANPGNTILVPQQQPNGQIIFVPASNPSPPQIITVPGPPGSPAQIISVPGEPSSPIVIGPNPPNCPRIFQCGVNQYFDERECRCRCAVQVQCRTFENFNQATCQCEQIGCPNTCSPCEVQNPTTCACTSRIVCQAPLVLDSNCQCSCGNLQFFRCNRQQRLNPQTCRCECSSYIATFEVEIPGRIVPPSIAPGLPEVRTRTTRRPGTARTPGGRRRTGKRSVDDEMEGPELDNVPLLREKRRRSRSPGTRSTDTRTRTVVVGTPTIVEGFQEPSTFRTETRQVLTCPNGSFQSDATCTCN